MAQKNPAGTRPRRPASPALVLPCRQTHERGVSHRRRTYVLSHRGCPLSHRERVGVRGPEPSLPKKALYGLLTYTNKGEAMPTILRIYSGADGQSHVEEMPLAMQPFVDT